MAHIFTSLRHPVEKLMEAEYFFKRSITLDGLEFQFVLNAFLSASRSVTFVLQKAMSGVDGFSTWYGLQQSEMKSDLSMRFFVELRNLTQKEGPVSYIGGFLPNGLCTYRFVGHSQKIPRELKGRDIRECCSEQLMKLATLLLKCQEAFPFASCPAQAFTIEGKTSLGYNWDDVTRALGLPDGYIDVVDIPDAEKLRILSKDIEAVDMANIQRIAAGKFFVDADIFPFKNPTHDGLIDRMADLMSSELNLQPHAAFISATMGNIEDKD
ncbi:TPA: hypothetical protein RSS26_000860 [Klebsiella pneumoniae]|nr:hypothetical protein [Klebsiella pneumoniae]